MNTRPADAGKVQLKRLVPLDVGEGVTNLKAEPHHDDQLCPVGMATPDDLRKPYGQAPRFWAWNPRFNDWLL